jgi:hypothetical protein
LSTDRSGCRDRVNRPFERAAPVAAAEPSTAGAVRGNIQVSEPSGEARIAFPVEGTRASGVVYVYAQKRFEQWRIDEMLIEI